MIIPGLRLLDGLDVSRDFDAGNELPDGVANGHFAVVSPRNGIVAGYQQVVVHEALPARSSCPQRMVIHFRSQFSLDRAPDLRVFGVRECTIHQAVEGAPQQIHAYPKDVQRNQYSEDRIEPGSACPRGEEESHGTAAVVHTSVSRCCPSASSTMDSMRRPIRTRV